VKAAGQDLVVAKYLLGVGFAPNTVEKLCFTMARKFLGIF
jgi:hypothetical protein